MRTQKHCGRCGQRLDIEYEVDVPVSLDCPRLSEVQSAHDMDV